MKNKKKLLVAVAAMGLLAVGTAGVGTAAWYAADSMGVKANETTNISTAKTANLSDLVITANYAGTGGASAIKAVELTQASDGVTKVWNGADAVPASNQGSLVKSERIKLTFTGASMTNYVGLTYTVTMKATGQLRIATSTNAASDAAWTTNNYVSTYSAATAYDDVSHTFTGGTGVAIGTITIASASTFTYASLLDIDGNSEVETDGLYFYVSISNKGANAAAESNTAADYGLIGVSSIAA